MTAGRQLSLLLDLPLLELPERIATKIAVNPDTLCWEWTARIYSVGYGAVTVGDQRRNAHCVVYELLVGPVPEGLELDGPLTVDEAAAFVARHSNDPHLGAFEVLQMWGECGNGYYRQADRG